MNTEIDEAPHTDPTGPQPQLLDNWTRTFQANGTTYHVLWDTRLSIARERHLEKMSVIAMSGARDLPSLLGLIQRAYAAVNGNKLADAAVLLDNVMQGVVDLSNKYAPIYWICALFINREGEDARLWDPNDAQRKINDWEAEGLDRDFFLGLGLGWLKHTGQVYALFIQDYSALGIQELPERGMN